LEFSKTAERLNEEYIFHPEDRRVLYLVRDPMLVYSHLKDQEAGNAHHGFALSVSIRSMGFESCLAFDGLYKYPVLYGTTAVLRVDPEGSVSFINF